MNMIIPISKIYPKKYTKREIYDSWRRNKGRYWRDHSCKLKYQYPRAKQKKYRKWESYDS